jgi:hypothetical protein
MVTSRRPIRFGGSDLIFFRRMIAAAVFVAATFAVHMLAAEAQGIRPPGQLPAQQQRAEPEQIVIPEVELTQSHIDAFIATNKEIAPVTAKLKGDRQPTGQVMAQMDAIANKYGFNDFEDFAEVGTNVRRVFRTINPESRKYDPEAMIRQQIGAVHGDSKISPKQKLQTLNDLHRALKSGAKLKYPANAELVARNYDRLRPLMVR